MKIQNSSLYTSVALATLLAASCSGNDDPRPAPDLAAGSSYAGTSLELYYNGEMMPGKSAEVTVEKGSGKATIVFNSSFDLSQLTGLGLTGSIPAPGVTPGDATLRLETVATAGDGAYEVSGDGATGHVTFSYSGSIAKEKMRFSLTDVKLKNTMLAGNVFAPAPIKKEGIADYTSLPFHLVWEIDPAIGKDIPLSEILKVLATAPVIPVYQGTAYTSVALGFESLVKTIALTESGNMPVMYVSTLGGAAHVATGCGNMLQYVPADKGIRLYINPLQVVGEVLLATSDNKNDVKFDFASMLKKAPARGDTRAEAFDGISYAAEKPDEALTRAMLGVLLKAIAPQISGGVPLALTPTEQGADIYFDTATSVTFLSTLLNDALSNPDILAAVKSALASANIPELNPQEVEALLQNLPQFLINTTRLEIGLSLVKK